ncbi:YajQ family cyclic di-GMP-binding protein [Granulosicoccus sp. 3-233]|uniref:YajQ family cyclic di-GMP-binding protein n=1 Tax=Granulosicoccus sp. 3-233 TaxID=3417969 RepID=UPI003D34A558
MPTFDVVSEVDQHELVNAVDHTQREIGNRFDFKGTSAKVELADGKIMLFADSDFQIQQIHPVLYQKLTARQIDIACLEAGKVENSGKGVKQAITVRQGIDREIAKKAVAKIKESKLKVQAQVQGEQLRVTGKKRDDLQAVMALLKGAELGLPMQFQNFRD